MIATARRGIAVSALQAGAKDGTAVATWIDTGGDRVSRARERLLALTESGEITVSRLSVAAGLMADLAGQ